MKEMIEPYLNNSKHNEYFYHLEKIDKIIVRMEKNHFRWYLLHISLLAFTITIYTFIFKIFENLNFSYKLTIFIIAFLSINLISFIIFYNSENYLKMGRAFRKMEEETIKNKSIPIYKNWKLNKDSKKGITFWTSLLISIIIMSTSLIVPLLLIV